MDIFKRELAPLSAQAWSEIDNRAKEVLLSKLTARKVVKVEGPKGIDFTSVNEGRLDLIDEGEVASGLYSVKPLLEARIKFTLNKWELDNIIRGAKDIDFDNLDEAVEKLALFEENAIYNGYAKAGIDGLKEASAHEKLAFGTEPNDTLAAVTEAMLALKNSYIHGPYTLVVGKMEWMLLIRDSFGKSLLDRVEKMLGSKVVLAPSLEGALLVPFNNENLELTIGQDFALGYEYHDNKEVTLFATESFTFRILEPKAIVVFK